MIPYDSRNDAAAATTTAVIEVIGFRLTMAGSVVMFCEGRDSTAATSVPAYVIQPPPAVDINMFTKPRRPKQYWKSESERLFGKRGRR